MENIALLYSELQRFKKIPTILTLLKKTIY